LNQYQDIRKKYKVWFLQELWNGIQSGFLVIGVFVILGIPVVIINVSWIIIHNFIVNLRIRRELVQTQNIPIESGEMNNLKEGDIIITIEFRKEDEKSYLHFNEFEFVNYIDEDKKSFIEGVEITDDSILAELKNIKFEKVVTKTDISRGFFRTKREAVDNFRQSIEDVYNEVMAVCNEFKE